MNRIYFFIFFVVLYLLLEYYVFQAARFATLGAQTAVRKWLSYCYWVWVFLPVIGGFFLIRLGSATYPGLRVFITSFFFINFIAKFFVALLLFGDDLRRFVSYIAQFFESKQQGRVPGRSEFMNKAALLAGAIPLAGFSFGIISGAHDYRVRRRVIYSPNLPKIFDGIRVVQISDIHTGSFFNKTAVKGGVDLINQQKADLVLFTGDLVNNQSDEAKPYLDIFSKIKSPLGVHSIMGNHDYGDYNNWDSIAAKEADIRNLHEMHRYMGWNIMLNEHKLITVEGESIALLGIENWGMGRFSKYGDLAKTFKGSEEIPYKLLMSHDPSHWDSQVLPSYPAIDLMLAGHTHGMQFGVEIGNFRWSPSQYIYKQWADLYQMGNQSLYVNRGFGYLGYPGRIGILPEITVLELKRGIAEGKG
jgi:uncharacterized protein